MQITFDWLTNTKCNIRTYRDVYRFFWRVLDSKAVNVCEGLRAEVSLLASQLSVGVALFTELAQT